MGRGEETVAGGAPSLAVWKPAFSLGPLGPPVLGSGPHPMTSFLPNRLFEGLASIFGHTGGVRASSRNLGLGVGLWGRSCSLGLGPGSEPQDLFALCSLGCIPLGGIRSLTTLHGGRRGGVWPGLKGAGSPPLPRNYWPEAASSRSDRAGSGRDGSPRKAQLR